MVFHIARAASTTGESLKTLVEEYLAAEGAPNRTADVCYGVGYTGPNRALNAHCSRYNKREQARILHEGLGLESLAMFDNAEAAIQHLTTFEGALFARKEIHSKGRDIKVVLEPWQVAPLLANGYSFFTAHVPSVREFRTWVYRKRHLGTYEKVLRRPEQCNRLGRNYDNGFDFSGVENANVTEGLKAVARKAVALLDLDFGAVDILQTAEGRYVVLEVNSAPGVSHERRKVIRGLAKRIARWCINDCPERTV